MDIVIPLVIITVLILLNGLFVAAEFAILGAPKALLDHKASQGDRVARVIGNIVRNPRLQDRYIATAQLGITFASLGLGMYGEHVLAHWLVQWFEGLGASRWIAAHTLASVVAVGILTYLHIVVGEMVPKSLALQHAERTVRLVTRPMLAFKAVMYPLVVALNEIGNALLRLMGVNRQEASADHLHTPEDLQMVVQESQEEGLLKGEAGQVLQDLFSFSELTAGEAMVPRVRIVGLRLGASPEQIAEVVSVSRHTRYPIYTESLDQIIGTVHIKDLMLLLARRKPLSRRDVRIVPYIPETTTLERVFNIMRGQRVQMAVVMDEHGGTAGLITMEDLMEEVVGEIDEKEPMVPNIFKETPTLIRVAGIVRLDDLGEALEIDLKHDEVDTVSGLVLMLLERPPVIGDSLTYHDLRFTVTAVQGNGVGRCLVERTDPSAGSTAVS